MGCCVSINEEGEYLCCSLQDKRIEIEDIFKDSTSEFKQFDSSSSIIMFESIRGEDTCRDSQFGTPLRITPFELNE